MRCYPEEACGLLFGKGGIIEIVISITNDLHSPTQFRMNPSEQARAFIAMDSLENELIAIFHSHPTGPECPSQTDLQEYAYPGVFYLIWYFKENAWSCRAFRIHEHEYQELEIVHR